jgi:S1-C subfamily serine protease
MRTLQDAGEQLRELEGRLKAMDALAAALLDTWPGHERSALLHAFDAHAQAARGDLQHMPEPGLGAFESDVARTRGLIQPPEPARSTVEPVLLTTARIGTFDGTRALTGASGFFFERDERLFLVTSRHVLFDAASEHRPDRIEIGLHVDPHDLARVVGFSIPLYRDRRAVWRQATDAGGEVDVAAIEIDREALPKPHVLRAFTPEHLLDSLSEVEVGRPLLIVGYPLGFHDMRHHLPVARQAAIASAFGVRFQGQGLFLTDARTHRGTSGAPVLLHDEAARRHPGALPWVLLGVHAARMDMAGRDRAEDESLGLNCAWYADVLRALTAPRAQSPQT